MRVNEQEITSPSDIPKFNKAQKVYYNGRTLQKLFNKAAKQQSSSYNHIPIFKRAPYIRLPIDDPTLFKLFSIFFTPYLLSQLAYFTNKKVYK